MLLSCGELGGMGELVIRLQGGGGVTDGIVMQGGGGDDGRVQLTCLMMRNCCQSLSVRRATHSRMHTPHTPHTPQ